MQNIDHFLSGQEFSGIMFKRIDDSQATEVLIGLKIFGQKKAAGSGFGRRDDERIPERNLVTRLNSPAQLKNLGVDCGRMPGEKISNLGLSLFDGLWRAAIDIGVELLQNLKA